MRGGLERALQAGVKVVLSTRTGSGTIRGSRDSAQNSIIGAGNLNPYKARMLLSLALAFSDDAGQIQEWFNEF